MEDQNSQSGQKDISDKGKPKKRLWLWWLGGSLALICILVSISIVLLAKKPLMNAEYSIPPTVHQGDEFDLIISMKNATSETIFIMDFILDQAIGPSILDGSVVVYTEPEMKIFENYKGGVAYSYYRTISPGETQTVKFHLRAQTVGTFGGAISAFAGRPNLYRDAIYIDQVTVTISP